MSISKILLASVLSLFLIVPPSHAFVGIINYLRAKHVADCLALAELCTEYNDEQSCTDFLNSCDDVAIEQISCSE